MQRANPVVDYTTWLAVAKCLLPKWLPGNRDTFQFFHINWMETLTDPFFLRWVLTFTTSSLFPNQQQEYKQIAQLNFTQYAVNDMVDMMTR